MCLADKGSQDIAKIHALSYTPKKMPEKARLRVENKQSNQQLAKLKVISEHTAVLD